MDVAIDRVSEFPVVFFDKKMIDVHFLPCEWGKSTYLFLFINLGALGANFAANRLASL